MNRTSWRRFWMGLLTVLRISPRGFFIPYRYVDAIGKTPPSSFNGVNSILGASEQAFLELLNQMDGFGEAFSAIGNESPPAPRWRQDWFPALDAASAYTIIRKHRPGRIVEIGCGHSTRFFARAVLDGELKTDITAIDPVPRAELTDVGVNFIRATIQDAIRETGNEAFDDLRAGDILSIDSSHILMPGTDVDILLNRILPSLPRGILVHIHDMFLPDDYPASWGWRGYNEQLGVALLMLGGGYRPLWSSHYVRTRMKENIAGFHAVNDLELPDGAYESSLWLVKEDAP